MLQLLLLAWITPLVTADIYLYGARHEVPHYGYAYDGLDWPDEYGTCSGSRQSPINVPGHTTFLRIPQGQETQLDYGKLASNGSNIKVVNNGHTVQVVMPANYAPNTSVVVRGDPSTATLVTKFYNSTGPLERVRITPTQFHFHTRGEHVIDGKEFLMELHIVNFVYNTTLPGCGASGCATVVSVMFELADDNDPLDEQAENCVEFLNAVWGVMPTNEGESAYIPSNTILDFNHILPTDRSYITYEGSLTTPPCTEGILWHVLATPLKIKREHLVQFELAVGMTNCTDKDDAVFHVASANSSTVVNGTEHNSTASAATNSTEGEAEEFEVPEFKPDAQDGLLCRKLAGQNFRDVQERDSRPLWFYAADALCELELLKLQNMSKAMHKLVFESETTDGITLHQYQDIKAAGLTKSSGCDGMAGAAAAGGNANAAQRTTAAFLQVTMSVVLLCWFLLVA